MKSNFLELLALLLLVGIFVLHSPPPAPISDTAETIQFEVSYPTSTPSYYPGIASSTFWHTWSKCYALLDGATLCPHPQYYEICNVTIDGGSICRKFYNDQ